MRRVLPDPRRNERLIGAFLQAPRNAACPDDVGLSIHVTGVNGRRVSSTSNYFHHLSDLDEVLVEHRAALSPGLLPFRRLNTDHLSISLRVTISKVRNKPRNSPL